MSLLLALVCAWCFERAAMIISAPNYGSPYNGFGAIDLTYRQEIKAPMSYRVLVPFLVRWIERLTHLPRVGIYQGCKLVLNTLMFWSVGQAFGLNAALLTGLLLLLTVKFDYWSWAPEVAGVALAMTGEWSYALTGGVLAAFSKETALLVPVAFFLRTMDPVGSVIVLMGTGLVFIGVRLAVGERELYCERFQVHYNLGLFKHFLQRDFWRQGQWYHQDIFIAVALTGLVVAGAIAQPSLVQLVPLALLAAGWTLAKADETRVFAAVLPFIASFLLGGWYG
jgi:hypothetical protein